MRCAILVRRDPRTGKGHTVADPVATFSILGFDPETGEVGGAVQSRVFTLTGVLTADADAGIVATQAIVDVSYGPKGIELLKKGMAPDAIIKQIWESDPDPVPDRWTKQGRQFAVMNLKGEAATFTGPKATTLGRRQAWQVLRRAGQHPRRSASRRRDDQGVRRNQGPLVDAVHGGA